MCLQRWLVLDNNYLVVFHPQVLLFLEEVSVVVQKLLQSIFHSFEAIVPIEVVGNELDRESWRNVPFFPHVYQSSGLGFLHLQDHRVDPHEFRLSQKLPTSRGARRQQSRHLLCRYYKTRALEEQTYQK